MISDRLRRIVGWLLPAADVDALAALDGGPGPEPELDLVMDRSPLWEPRPMSDGDFDAARASFTRKLAAGLDLPEEWLTVPGSWHWTDPDAIAEMHRQYDTQRDVERLLERVPAPMPTGHPCSAPPSTEDHRTPIERLREGA